MRTLAAILSALLLQGCMITAPTSFAWRSNSTQQVASTEGRNDRKADANTVNADRQTEVSVPSAAGKD